MLRICRKRRRRTGRRDEAMVEMNLVRDACQNTNSHTHEQDLHSKDSIIQAQLFVEGHT